MNGVGQERGTGQRFPAVFQTGRNVADRVRPQHVASAPAFPASLAGKDEKEFGAGVFEFVGAARPLLGLGHNQPASWNNGARPATFDQGGNLMRGFIACRRSSIGVTQAHRPNLAAAVVESILNCRPVGTASPGLRLRFHVALFRRFAVVTEQRGTE